jgi:subtilisin family serine protease
VKTSRIASALAQNPTARVGGPFAPRAPEPSGGSNSGPVVAVFDGAVDVTHQDLDGAMWVNPGEVAGDNLDNDGNGVIDDVNGYSPAFDFGLLFRGDQKHHGTHVAGIIAGEDNGVGGTGVAAGKAQVLSVGGIYEDPERIWDGKAMLRNFEKGVDYVIKMKRDFGVDIRVVNASLGESNVGPDVVARWRAAVQKLADANILLVTSAANKAVDMDQTVDMPGNLDLPNVITVAALDEAGEALWPYSAFGVNNVDLAAPGQNILGPIPAGIDPGGSFERFSGTSMAAAYVSGAAALLFEANPSLTAEEAREILMSTVQADDDLAGKVASGGKIDVDAALAEARSR